jgi:hypothetical protein
MLHERRHCFIVRGGKKIPERDTVELCASVMVPDGEME